MSSPLAPRQQLRNRLEEVREWLMEHIDGGEEVKGYDSILSGYIATIDDALRALPPSETTPIPQSKTQAKRYAAQMEPRGCPTPGACSAVEELADLKQRLLPQFLGRAERAEKARQMAVVERDSLLEKLRAATSMPCAPSATAATDADFLAPQDDPKAHRRCKCEFSGGGVLSKQCEFHRRLLATKALPVEEAEIPAQLDGLLLDTEAFAKEIETSESLSTQQGRASVAKVVRRLAKQYADLYRACLHYMKSGPVEETATVERLTKALHALRAHPDYEYATTDGPRKMGLVRPPEGDGWEENKDFNEGFERFEYHEEGYWRRCMKSQREIEIEKAIGGSVDP